MGERVAVRVGRHRPPAGDGERAFVDDLWRDPPAADDAHRERVSAANHASDGDRLSPRGVSDSQTAAPNGSSSTQGTGRRVPLGSSSDQASELAVGDRRVVPLLTGVGLGGPAAAAEAAVQPRRRRRRIAVPAPDVQRPRAPRALGDERRTIPRHHSEGTHALSQRGPATEPYRAKSNVQYTSAVRSLRRRPADHGEAAEDLGAMSGAAHPGVERPTARSSGRRRRSRPMRANRSRRAAADRRASDPSLPVCVMRFIAAMSTECACAAAVDPGVPRHRCQAGTRPGRC